MREFLLCMSVDDALEVAEGSSQTNCSQCDKRIWIAPTSAQLVIDKGLTIVCFKCAEELCDGEIQIEGPTPEQMEEIIRHLKKGTHESLHSVSNRKIRS